MAVQKSRVTRSRRGQRRSHDEGQHLLAGLGRDRREELQCQPLGHLQPKFRVEVHRSRFLLLLFEGPDQVRGSFEGGRCREGARGRGQG